MITARAIGKKILPAAFLLAAALGFGQTLYWESPQVFVPQGVGSSSSAIGRSLAVLAWQEIKPRSATDGDIFLSLAVSRDGVSWKSHLRFFAPIHYTSVSEGNEPRLYSMIVDSSDRILFAVSVSDRETAILQSVDQGASFQEVQRLSSPVPTGAPNLYPAAGGGFLLIVAQGSSRAEVAAGTGSVAFAVSTSRNGKSWTPFAPFVTPADKLGNPQLQASHVILQGRDYVVFQSLSVRSESTNTWQLFMKSSSDGGVTWDPALPITTRPGPFGDDPLGFNNERPRLAALDGRLELVWERSPFGSDAPKIWTVRLDGTGGLVAPPEALAAESPARFARIISLKGQEYVLYADGSRGAFRIVLAQKGRTWETQPLQNTDVVNALFPHALVIDNALYIFWENQATAGGSSSLVQLRPLASVGSPIVKAVDFRDGQPANKDSVTISWSEPQPPDPSGIKEYRYTWSYSDGAKTVEVEKKTVSGLTSGARGLVRTLKADKDGTWTFSIVALDLAGNLSHNPATASFVRDSVPPKPVSFEVADAAGRVLLAAPPGEPEKRDLNGYAVDSNTFTLRWRPAGDTDIAGYTYNDQPGWADLAQYRASKVPLLAPPPRVVTTSTDITFRNADNGVYAITVRAIDKAGNISAPSTIALALSHYLPFTVVNDFNSNKDLFGTVRLTILGRGFTANGKVRKVYLDRGDRREPPWDIEVDPTGPVTVTDRTISGIVLDANRQSGKYRVVLAQDRPSGTEFYFSNVRYDFESPGTVKIGNFELLLPRWAAGRTPGHSLPVESLLILLIVLLLGTLSVLSIRRMFALAQEGAILRGEVLALISGQTNVAWEERKKRMQALKKKGVGLRLKFTLLMVVLVTMIVLIVSVPLGYQMVGRQRLALASGLRNNASILMDALAASAETQFRLGTDGFVSAGDIPSLRTAMAEANFTTITGPDPSLSPLPYPKDFVWASDQKEFAAERARGTFRIAKESVKDDLARSAAPTLQKHVDTDAANKYASLIEEYRTLKGQAAELRTRTDAASKARVTALTALLAQKSAELDTQAKADYASTSTLEPFNPAARLSPTYLFYKPIIYYNRADNVADTSFYQGLVRLEVKTDAITRQINESIGTILKTASAIALAAIALGVLGAIIMASITVTPIRKLAQGVAKIRDTEKKEDLKDHVIVVGSRDEIGELADTVNTMTQGLVKAALANNELLAGIDVQKRFLPLVKGAGAVTGSTAEEDRDPRVEVYGYYRGAKGVSGDYFDFKKLDESHYALIKCDIAGKGVSAALIMVEVATIFISFFKEWVTRKETIAQITDQKARQKAMHELDRIDSLVYRINDMLEERGFPGRFAALTICILNTETGVTSVCNAGDTILNVYESDQKRMVHNQLPDSPAAGTFASMLVEMKAPYKQVNQKLDHGDVLFLQTDGIEESKRKLRNSAFQEIVCDEPGLAAGEVHLGTHKKGDKEGTEEFGTTRIDGVLNAVFARGTYTLVRNHNPIPNEELTFDFSSCTGTAREAVLALIAVEKVYRQIPDPAAPEASRVLVDTKVADFLEKHFKQHGRYFAHPMKDQSVPGYVTFSHAREDDQYDDLTILVVRRK